MLRTLALGQQQRGRTSRGKQKEKAENKPVK
jgi:hypothetical protein